jgi:hypothetical protein
MTVDVVAGAKLSGERFLIIPWRDGNGLEAHLRSELNSQVAETSHAEYGEKITGPRTAVAKRVEGGDPRRTSEVPRLRLKGLPGSTPMFWREQSCIRPNRRRMRLQALAGRFDR